eukprot:2452147-Rhodomonas_salina.3
MQRGFNGAIAGVLGGGSEDGGDGPRDFVTLVPQYCVYCGKALMHEVGPLTRDPRFQTLDPCTLHP